MVGALGRQMIAARGKRELEEEDDIAQGLEEWHIIKKLPSLAWMKGIVRVGLALTSWLGNA